MSIDEMVDMNFCAYLEVYGGMMWLCTAGFCDEHSDMNLYIYILFRNMLYLCFCINFREKWCGY